MISAANRGYARTNIPPPGLVGGPCLHKDPHILIESLRRYAYTPRLISYGRHLNESIPNYVCQKLKDRFDFGSGAGLKMTVMGLAFKGRPETSDIRASPSLDLIVILKKMYPEARLCGHDFVVSDQVIHETGLEAVSVKEAFEGASLVIIATNNERYQWLDIDALIKRMATPKVIFDVWSILPFSIIRDNQDCALLSLGTVADGGKAA